MNIKDVKDALEHRYNEKTGELEIVIAWWDKEWFETMLNTKLSDDEWWEIVVVAEGVVENCYIGEYLFTEALKTLNQLRKKGDK